MSRIININNPSKVRNQNQRTIAEILRRIGAKSTIDDESKDMVSTIVYLLREIFVRCSNLYYCLGKERLLDESRSVFAAMGMDGRCGRQSRRCHPK